MKQQFFLEYSRTDQENDRHQYEHTQQVARHTTTQHKSLDHEGRNSLSRCYAHVIRTALVMLFRVVATGACAG